MNTNIHSDERHRGLWKVPALITALILGIPLLRSLFARGCDWDIRVFLLVGGVGTLLFSHALAFQMLIKKLGSPAYRAGVGVALMAAFFLVWGNFVQAADDVNHAAMMYLAVPVVGIIGAAAARFQAKGMALALFMTALAQALILVIVLVQNPPVTSWSAAVWRGFGGNAFFFMLFVGSALLFRKAARAESASGAV